MCMLWLVLSLQCTLEGGSTVIRGTSSGADDVIGNGKCVLSGHLREAIWMIASNKFTVLDPCANKGRILPPL